MKTDEIENIFTYHAPFGDQPLRYEAFREAARKLAHLINQTTPPSREQSLAFTSLQQTIMWAIAAIAINEKKSSAQLDMEELAASKKT